MTRLPNDIINLLDHHIEAGNIRVQTHPEYPIAIHNYTPQVQYSGTWDEVTKMCRGLILDLHYNIVARPFPKFFNWGELDGETQYDLVSQCDAYVSEKWDGSLGILYRYEGTTAIATRGSFTSDQALWATKKLADYDYDFHPSVTPLFEIIYPQNRIVVDYGDMKELVLLEQIDNESGRSVLKPFTWNGPQIAYEPLASLDDLATEGRNREGYVIAFTHKEGIADEQRVKVKLEEYVRLHRILTGTNAVRVWEAMQTDDLDILLQAVPDEFYQWVKGIAENLDRQYADIERVCTTTFHVLRHLAEKSRKDYALKVKDHPYYDILFKMLDGKDYSQNIWKRIKPEATLPFMEEV